jgi:serine protease Do
MAAMDDVRGRRVQGASGVAIQTRAVHNPASMSASSRDGETWFRLASPVLAAMFVLATAGGWTCSDLSAHKPGDESISVPLDGPRSSTAPSAATGTPRKVPPGITPGPPAPGAVSASPAALTPRTDPPNEARVLSRAFANVARALGPSVVRVDVEVPRAQADDDQDQGGADPGPLPPPLRRFFQFGRPVDPGPQRGTGSGIILDGAGNIITNRHVVSHASKVSVTLNDGRELSAKVVGTDRQTDVAVVRLESPPADLVAARMGDSDKLDVGEWVLAVGSPLGLDQTVTAGIVSGRGRVGRHVQMSGERVRHYIQTDAKINPGNSGGPLVNLGSEVVGINTLINTGPGGAYGFAIPINQARRVAAELIKEGRVKYPYLGVLVGDIRDLDPDKRSSLSRAGTLPAKGAFVSDITPRSPAERGGLRAGDVIMSIDGQVIDGAGDVIDYVSTRSIGSRLEIAYLREGKKASVSVVLAELPDRGSDGAGDDDQDSAGFGLSLQTLTPRLAEGLGLGAGARGAVIVEVASGSAAEKAGLGAGDVIAEIDRKPIATADEARAALHASRKGGHILRVRGPAGARFVTLADTAQ